MRKFFYIVLSVLFSLFLWGGTALAGFSDVPDDHWAAGNIEKMSELGVVGGYADGTFRPDNAVRQVEAVCMAVRAMGLQDSSPGDLPRLSFPVPGWAETDVKLALRYGLLKNTDQFSAYSGASRAWVTRLLVRMIGKETEAEEMLLLPNFIDSYKIPNWAVYYVRVAQDNDLVTGYDDNSFRPDKEVSRAEMVTFLSRAMECLPDRPAGSGSGVDTGLFGQRDSIVVKGKVVKVYPEINAVIIEDGGGSLKTLYPSDGSPVSIEGYGIHGLDALLPGDEVEATLNSLGYVSRILIISRAGVVDNEGVVYDLDTEKGLLTIQSDDKRLSSFRLSNYVEVKVKGVRFPGIEDVRRGDRVKINVEDGLVTAIEVLEASSRLNVAGKVVILDSEKEIINLEVDGRIQAYRLSPHIRVNVPGLDIAFLYDVDEGDAVTAVVKDGEVVSLEVSGRQVEDTPTATIYAVDTANRILTLKDRDSKFIAYEVLEEARINIDGSEDSELEDLERNMEVKYRLLDGDIIYLETDNSLKGTISSLDEEGLLLVLQRSSGERQTYILDKDVDVNSEDDRDELDDVKRGDYAQVVLENDKVTEINLRSMIIYRVERVRENYDRIEVVDEDGDSHRLYVKGKVGLVVPGVSYPDLDDVHVGDLVRATYMGHDLDTVEVLEPLRGEVTFVNNYEKSITVRLFNGETAVVEFTAGSKINIEKKEYDSLSKLEPGDRVEVVENLDGGYNVLVMEEVSGNLAADVDEDDDEVYLEEGYRWENYNLDEDVYVHDSNGIIADLDDLREGDRVRLYMLRDVVYELEWQAG